MPASSVKQLKVIKVDHHGEGEMPDAVAIEEPLEIGIEYGPENHRQQKNISVTMRTPGNDAELAAGFLFTEGIIRQKEEIASIKSASIACTVNKENTVLVSLKPGIEPNLRNADRNFYTTSSCGVCGKASIDAIRTGITFNGQPDTVNISANELYALPQKLLAHQEIFSSTGGLHASALFNIQGELLLVREDVGRHNALDKLIGAALNDALLPLGNHILLLSGRASFELVQKAAMAGIKVIAAVGAPSSLAVDLAEEFNITLIGFLRGARFNIYTGAYRIQIAQHENTY